MLKANFEVADIVEVSKSYAEANGYFRGLRFKKAFLDHCDKYNLLKYIGEKDRLLKHGQDFYDYCDEVYGKKYHYHGLVYRKLLQIPQLYETPLKNLGMRKCECACYILWQ